MKVRRAGLGLRRRGRPRRGRLDRRLGGPRRLSDRRRLGRGGGRSRGRCLGRPARRVVGRRRVRLTRVRGVAFQQVDPGNQPDYSEHGDAEDQEDNLGRALRLRRPLRSTRLRSAPAEPLRHPAVLTAAVKRNAALWSAVLRGPTVLRGPAVLGCAAVLRSAVLRGAVLRGAVLRGAVLRGAVLGVAALAGRRAVVLALGGRVVPGRRHLPLLRGLLRVLPGGSPLVVGHALSPVPRQRTEYSTWGAAVRSRRYPSPGSAVSSPASRVPRRCCRRLGCAR
ncbi:pentapeptide repeat-containing protein [Kribbella sp. VKM Ac-2568]|uniref:pentapeptide repeat-containing protein n=1 Tax=Kribbella sp. VKM Ac-2568 TaxID=2512219 RepID=UPI00351AAD86